MKVIKGGKAKTPTGKQVPKRRVRKAYDWEGIESAYRANKVSVCEIGRRYGISESYIRKRANEEGWERDLSYKVKAAVRNKIVREKSVRTKSKQKTVRTRTKTRTLTEKEIIEAAAEEDVSFIKTWDERFRENLKVATKLKEEIFKKIRVKIEGGEKTVLIDKYTPNQKAAVYNSVTGAEHKIFESMRKNLGIDDTGGREAPVLLMDYGTGNYEKELERRKTGTDSV